MGAIDDIRRMKQENMSEYDIIQTLKNRGLSQQEIDMAFAQSQIKDAISYDPIQQFPPLEEPPQDLLQTPIPQTRSTRAIPVESQRPAALEYNEMQPSPFQEIQAPSPLPQSEFQEAPEQEQFPQQEFDYSQQFTPQAQGPSLNFDTISEISEQIVSEKLEKLKTQLEKNLDLRTAVETQLSQLNDRLQRIEKIIDRLQLSVLQKVGDYVNSVSDLKKEVIETQKSFKALSHKPHHSEYHHPPEHAHKHKK